MQSDDALIQSIKQGRQQYFEILINRYKTPILNFIYKMITDYDDAQNLTQDVFITVYQKISRYRMEGNFQAYIFTIAKNLTLNHIKKNKRMINLSSFLSKNAGNRYFQQQDTQFSHLEKESQEQLLVAALKELKENQRIALILKTYLGFSYIRISEITGWSISKIETLISRAKSRLKNKIFLQENRVQNVKKVR